MIRIQYFANFVGDVAVVMSDIKKMCTGSPNFFNHVMVEYKHLLSQTFI